MCAIPTHCTRWQLKAHLAWALPVTATLHLARGDPYRLARTRDGLVLFVRDALSR